MQLPTSAGHLRRVLSSAVAGIDDGHRGCGGRALGGAGLEVTQHDAVRVALHRAHRVWNFASPSTVTVPAMQDSLTAGSGNCQNRACLRA